MFTQMMYLFIIAFIIWSNQIISIQSNKNHLTICSHHICTQKTVEISSYQNLLILNNDKIVELNINIISNKEIEAVINTSSDKTLPFQVKTICQRQKYLPLIGVKRSNKFQSRNSNSRGRRFNRGGGLQRGDGYPKFGPFNTNPFLLMTLLYVATGIIFELIIRIPQIPFIERILYILRKLYYLNVMCMNSDEKSSVNIKLRTANPIKKTKTTDASLGSKYILQRSKATKGISKSIHLQKPEKNEDFNCINDQLMNSYECKTNNKYRNCFMKSIPVDKSTGNKSMNHLVGLVGICRNACNSKIESERDEHLLKTVKDSIVNTDKIVRKRKVVDQSNEHPAPSSTSSSSSFQNTCDNSSGDDNLLPCFKSSTYCVEEKIETSLKFKHEYNFPDNLVSSDDLITYEEKNLCRKCFAHLHKFTVYEIETACARLKEDINAFEFIKEKWEDRTLHPYNYSEINAIYEANCVIDDDNLYTTGRPFDEGMVADAGLPANDNDMNVALWLEDCFLTYGDSAPNRNIHQLSSTFKKDLWKLYFSEMSKITMVPARKPVDESRFNDIWNSCFPNYLVRPYANVIGKCDTCYEIDRQRRAATDIQTKEALRQAHLMHRGGLFMLERKSYKRRVMYALKNPTTVMSCIWDGMDQSHSRCPHLGTQTEFSHPLKQHIQGILVHGVGLTLYRTFNNITKGADLSAHSFLCELDKWKKNHDDQFPEEILIQVDGGSENANKTIIALCEFLVTKRMVKSITLTRLPTGHTHEDIDACFAHIWKGMRQCPVHTVDEYVQKINNIFSGKLNATVTDLYIVADFSLFFKTKIDSKFSNWSKEEDTQHQFKFDAVPYSTDFPYGCRVMYRAYASDKVVEFVKKSPLQCISTVGQLTGLEPHTLLVSWGPKRRSTIDASGEVLGFYLLTEIPSHPVTSPKTLFPPKDFAEDSLLSFKQTIAEAKKYFLHRPDISDAWKQWEETKLGQLHWTAAEYAVEREILYQVPLIKYFQMRPDQTCTNANWIYNLKDKSLVIDDTNFDWPEQLAAATHSVRCAWQRDPMPSRVFSAIDDELRAVLSAFETKASDYYTSYLKEKTIENLKAIIKQRLTDVGQRLPTSGTKGVLLSKVKASDRAYLTVFYKSLRAENIALLSRVLYKPLRSPDEADSIQVTSTDKTLSLQMRHIRQFCSDQALKFEVMQYIILLFNQRNNLMCSKHLDMYGSEEDYTALKKIEYLMTSHNFTNIPNCTLENMNKVFFCFKQTCNLNKDDWVAVVVDFIRSEALVIDPSLVGNVVVTAALKTRLQLYENKIEKWMQDSNWMPEKKFECKFYSKDESNFEPISNEVDSGIYVTAIIDMISHDCPRFFAQADTYTIRQNICYSVLNNYLPY